MLLTWRCPSVRRAVSITMLGPAAAPVPCRGLSETMRRCEHPAASSPLHDRHVAARRQARRLRRLGDAHRVRRRRGAPSTPPSATAVGVFDVSHLGKARVRGAGAAAFVDRCLTNDLGRIGPGKAQYTLCCDETGGVVDDLIAYLVGDDDVFLVPNAANTAGVGPAARRGRAGRGHGHRRARRVRGARGAGARVAPRCSPRSGLPDRPLDYMSFVDADVGRARRCVVCRTGYTGEHGYELHAAVGRRRRAVGRAAAEAGRDAAGCPCGLGARDTLRTEMGYPLHGQDLGRDITPVQARSGWAVGWKKPAFWGRDALLAEKEAGRGAGCGGCAPTGRGIPRGAHGGAATRRRADRRDHAARSRRP